MSTPWAGSGRFHQGIGPAKARHRHGTCQRDMGGEAKEGPRTTQEQALSSKSQCAVLDGQLGIGPCRWHCGICD